MGDEFTVYADAYWAARDAGKSMDAAYAEAMAAVEAHRSKGGAA